MAIQEVSISENELVKLLYEIAGTGEQLDLTFGPSGWVSLRYDDAKSIPEYISNIKNPNPPLGLCPRSTIVIIEDLYFEDFKLTPDEELKHEKFT